MCPGPTTRGWCSAAWWHWRRTNDIGYLKRARELADASAKSDELHVDGVLTEPCEKTGCDTNGVSFKGIYVRNLGELNDALDDEPYTGYLNDQAKSAYEHDRDPSGRYGVHWAGPIAGVNAGTQQSAVDLVVAAMAKPEAETSGSGSGSSVPSGPSGPSGPSPTVSTMVPYGVPSAPPSTASGLFDDVPGTG